MWYVVICVAAVLTAGYFAFRYFTLVYALGKVTEELEEIQKDFTQNQMLHLPVPSRPLGRLLSCCNRALEGLRDERQSYEKREKEFKEQIEHISHDLRTPLTVILGYLKLMKLHREKEANNNCSTVEKELEEVLMIVEKKAETMNNLVTQFYDFSRLQAGGNELKLHKVDAVRILKEALLGSHQILEQASLEIETKLPKGPVWVLGEEGALERIFLNLLQNAGRYAQSYLRIAVEEQGHQRCISFVNDTGKLTKDQVPHLFERFYMQDSSRTRGSTGLGLTIAKALAEGMGAELEAVLLAEDTEQNLATISFELRIKAMA